jgi:hypothetical protein
MITALDVDWTTDCEWSLSAPVGKTRGNVDKVFGVFESIHILTSFSSLSRMASMKNIITLQAVLYLGMRILDDSIGLVRIVRKAALGLNTAAQRLHSERANQKNTGDHILPIGPTFKMLSALLITAKSRAPANDTKNVPSPPLKLVPPITTRAITASS